MKRHYVFLFLALLGFLIYFKSFSAPFVLDDVLRISENPRIRDVTLALSDVSNSRYVGFLTFALNYRFGGLDVFGYHLVNLLIHIANGCLVYALVRLLFRSSDTGDDRSKRTAAVAALLFVVHPLQTQAVTYVVQRFTSLATFFYLLGLVGYLMWKLRPKNRVLWYILSLIAAVAAMKTKEIAFTLPFMILLIEALFFRPWKSRRLAGLIPFFAAVSLIPLSSFKWQTEDRMFFDNVPLLPRSDYFFTQLRVIVTYLRLFFAPVGQNLDYDYPVYRSLVDPPVLASFLFLLVLFGSGVFFLRRAGDRIGPPKLVGFGVVWFFLTILTESSIVPIRDVIFEHRVYLPSVGVFLAVGAVWWSASHRRIKLLTTGAIVLLLSAAAYQRNLVWRDQTTLWEDVTKKSPRKARGHYNLGVAYQRQGRSEDAIRAYLASLGIEPYQADARNNLGLAYLRQGRFEDASRELQTALRINPNHFDARYNLGLLYRSEGLFQEARHEFERALKINPDRLDVRKALENLPH